MFYVYKIQNTENGKAYVGITSRSVSERWQEHISRARNNHRNSRLYAAMRKYGVDKFEVTVLDSAESEDRVREMEIEYISSLDTYTRGYNSNLGGHGFLVFPDEIRKKISEGQRGRVNSPETRAKMSAAKLGDSRCASNFGAHTEKGSSNPRAKRFIVERPDGRIESGFGLRAFCRDNDILHSKLSSRGKTKGFKLLGTFND